MQAFQTNDNFPENYFSSRSRFIAETSRFEAKLASLPVCKSNVEAGLGQSEAADLTIDIAVLGDPEARKTLFYIAGTHGVEGYMGAAIQQGILSRLSELPKGYNLVLVHCLNPWGMVNLRRVNSNNVDLNRNCIDNDELRVGAPDGYDLVRSLILPIASRDDTDFKLQIGEIISKNGLATITRAVASGQFVDQQGLFYGGDALQPELSVVREWVANNLNHTKELIAIDLHSGLGNFCTDALLVDSREGTDAHKRKKLLFPYESIDGFKEDNSESYQTLGSLSALLPPVLPDAKIDLFVHEFGTKPALDVLYALVEENYHYFNSQEGEKREDSAGASARLKEAFCPSESNWRERTVERGLEVFLAAAEAINKQAS